MLKQEAYQVACDECPGMLDHGKIEKEAYKELCTDIKYRMEDWQADCAQWNDPDADNPFAFF